MIRRLSVKLLPWGLGIIYVFLIDFGGLGINLGATIFYSLLIATLVALNLRNKPTKELYLVAFISLGTAIAFTFTTNTLMYQLNLFSTLFAVSLLTISLQNDGSLPQKASNYMGRLLFMIKDTLAGFFVKANMHEFFLFTLNKDKGTEDKSEKSGKTEYILGFFISIPILVIFHILFSQINIEYVDFIEKVARFIWDIVKNFWEIILNVLKITLSSYLFFLLFTARNNRPAKDGGAEGRLIQSLKVVLLLSVILFAVFSFFQSKLLFVNLATLPFKEISTYVQKGFWELLIASVFGYGICLAVAKQMGKDRSKNANIIWILFIFLVELVLLTIFSKHKLISHMYLFGFKDQRIMASVAVGLISGTFVLFTASIFNLVNRNMVFKFQLFGLLIATLALNILNVDLFLTKVNPISYYLNSGEKVKDYSYLLSNSNDNYSEWLSLTSDLKKEGVRPPDNEYYWGNYQPLCKTYSYPTSVHSQIETKYNGLLAYDTWLDSTGTEYLKGIINFNFNNYKAYLLYKENKADFDNLVELAKESCSGSIKQNDLIDRYRMSR